jgi:hypothetical protein
MHSTLRRTNAGLRWRGPRSIQPDAPQLGGYRVEYRGPAGAAVLHESDLCAPHHSALAPYASKLLLSGRAEGELALIDPVTGRVVARRRVQATGQRRSG